ncbi:MAG: TMEM175 family protein [Streptosporangiaceae bacterium]
MDSGRLEAFSDGVFAVAITLLALDLTISGPGGESLARKLGGHWPAFVAYAVSFATIGIIWVNHHTLFKNFADVDRPLLFLNLLLLFFVVSIPFATSTIAAYLRAGDRDAALAAVVYQGVFEGMSISFGLLLWWAIRHKHLKVALTPDQARRATIRFGIGNLGYIAAIGVAFASAYASLAISGLVAIYYMFEQTPARDGPATVSAQPPDDPPPPTGSFG